LSDTVGFIRNLPTTVVKAFRATLEEVKEAALVLHVVDVSAPSALEHASHVRKVLSEIGAAEISELLVLNKIDRLPDDSANLDALRRRLLSGHKEEAAVCVSGVTGAGIDQLLSAIDEHLPADPLVRTTLRLPSGDGATLALLHEFGRVLEIRYDGDFCEVRAEIPESLQRRLERR
jgi:GTP-binding protein HflX